ncbi:hypothetical protein D9M70_635290 [compost metagenome]
MFQHHSADCFGDPHVRHQLFQPSGDRAVTDDARHRHRAVLSEQLLHILGHFQHLDRVEVIQHAETGNVTIGICGHLPGI